MREPSLQCAEEFEFYKEIFEYVLADLQKIRCENGIITEGAAYIPNLMKQIGIPGSRYISITPKKNFRFPISKREHLFHLSWKDAAIRKRLFAIGWREMFCLPEKCKNNVAKTIIFPL